jgi:hypothetical protein
MALNSVTPGNVALAFDDENLLAAIEAVRHRALTLGAPTMFDKDVDAGRKIDLVDDTQVRDWLLARAHAVYVETRKRGVVAGLIREVMYSRIGIVFEPMPTEMKGGVTSRGTGAPDHIAFFWLMLL